MKTNRPARRKPRRPGAVIIALCAFIATTTLLPAQTVTWDGGGDGVSWHDPLNWSGDALPGPANDVSLTLAESAVEFDGPDVAVQSLTASIPFTLVSGELSASNGFSFSTTSVTYEGGAFGGPVQLVNASLDISNEATNAASFTAFGACSFSGMLHANQSLSIQGSGTGDGLLTLQTGAVNRGLISLETISGTRASRLLTSGSATNDATGEIRIEAGTGGPRSVEGELINRGVLHASTASLSVHGIYESAGGSVIGNVFFHDIQLRVSDSPAAPLTLTLRGTTTLLTDNFTNTTLWVQGSGSGNALLIAPDSFSNHGTIHLQTVSGTRRSDLTVTGTLHNAASGRIEVERGTGGARDFTGGLQNEGTLSVAADTALYMHGTDRTWNQLDGEVLADGRCTWADGDFHLLGGVITGDFYLRDAMIDIHASATHSNRLFAAGACTLLNNRSPETTVHVEANAFYGHATLTTHTNGAKNLGTLLLRTLSGIRNSNLSAPGAGVTNGPTGLILSEAGSGGARAFTGTLVNQGQVASFDYRIDFEGGVMLDGGRFDGTVRIRNSQIEIVAAPPEPTTLLLWTSNTLTSDNPTNVTLLVQASGDGNATLNWTSGWNNFGTLALDCASGTRTATVNSNGSTIENHDGGRIEFRLGTGGTRTINAPLINHGVIRTERASTVSATGAQHKNYGTMELVNATLTFGGDSLTNQPAGLIMGAGTLHVSGLSFVNAGRIDPGLSTGRITLTGAVRHTDTAQIDLEIGGLVAATDFDQLVTSGAATLDGTVNISLIEEFAPTEGDIFSIINYNSVTGAFYSFTGLAIDEDLAFEPVYLSNRLELRTVASTNLGTTPPSILVQPASQTVLQGGAASFSVTANGSLPLHYQWRYQGDDLPSATQHTLSLANVQTNQSGGYTVVVSNHHGAVTSAVATLVVFAPAQTVYWDGGGDGASWHDPLNWSGNFVPTATNDVIADVEEEVTITVAGNTTVGSLRCEENLHITGGTLMVTDGDSWVNGSLTVNAARGLTVQGSNTTFTANGPTTINGAVLRAQQGGHLYLPEAATFTSGQLILTNATANLPALTNVNLSRFLLYDGATYTLPPAITNYNSSGGMGISEQRTIMLAQGAGTRLDLSALQSIDAVFSGLGGLRQLVTASDGGEIDLSGVTVITGGGSGANAGGPLEFRTDADSFIHLDALTTLNGTSAGIWINMARPLVTLPLLETALRTQFFLPAGSEFQAPLLTSLERSRLNIPDEALWNAPLLQTFVRSTLQLSGSGSFQHGTLATIDFSRFLLSAGATYTLPDSVRDFLSSEGFGINEQRTLFSASGEGTRLDMSSLTNLTAVFSGLGGLRLLVTSSTGAEIDLSGVQTITGGGSGVNNGGPFEFRADATGTVNLSGLEQGSGTGAGLLFNLGGTNRLGAAELTLSNAHMILPADCLLQTGLLHLGNNTHLSGTGTLEGDLLNAGVVRPGTSPGRIQILGNYTQAPNGVFIAEVGGPTPGTQYDQLAITGHAALDGTLDLRLINNYAPDLSETFHILSASSNEGIFTTVLGADAGNSVEFVPAYEEDGVWLGLIFATGPSVIHAFPAQTVRHTFDHFLLTFSEPIQAASFTAADVTLLGPDNEPIPVNAPQFLSNTLWRISFEPQFAEGAYTLTVGPAINDLVGNPMNQNGNEINGEPDDAFLHVVTVPPAVDFVAESIVAPEAASVGTPVFIEWTVSNQSTNPALGPRTDSVYLSTDPAVGNDVWLGDFTTSTGLDAGASQTITNLVVLPQDTSGTRYFIVEVDSAREWFELSETNNIAISEASTLVSAADLTVTSVTASESSAQFGDTLTLTWTVQNIGNVSASATWRDRLYLSPTPAVTAQSIALPLDHHGGPLAADASYTNSAVITLPLSADLGAGTYHLLVLTDVNNAQPEANEANNLGSRSISLTLPPLPDLVADSITAPPVALPGHAIEVNWSVTNAGAASAPGGWFETIHAIEETPGSQPVQLGRFYFTNTLAAGESVARTRSVTLPPTALSGDVRFRVTVDSEAAVVESDKTNNSALTADTTLVPLTLTLSLPLAQVREDTAQPVLSALVQRNGSLSTALDVALSSSHTNHVTVPASVLIPAGQASATFPATVLWDRVPTPDISVTLTAAATDFTDGTSTLLVQNVDQAELILIPEADALIEGESMNVTVSRYPVTDQPLLVQLTSHSTEDLATPVSITVPAHVATASFVVSAPDNTRIQPTRNVNLAASAAGHRGAVTTITVFDNDNPTLLLDLQPPIVAEDAGPGAVLGTVHRIEGPARDITLQLASGDTNTVLVPARVTLPAASASVGFPIDILDDDIVNGTREIDILAWITDTQSGARIGDPIVTQLTVTDNDGPHLAITLPNTLLPEGSNMVATVTRNTEPTEPLTVSLLSSDASIATLPASVVIPAGTNAADFLVSAVPDGAPNGTRSVTLTAEAADHEPGIAVLQVTDVDLPDIVVTEVSGPASGFTGQGVSLSFRVANQGLAPFTNAIVQRVWLSSDPLSDERTLVGEFTFNQAGESIPPGASFQQSISAFLPHESGAYWIIVTADALNAVAEIDENNNTRISSAPIQVLAEFTAVVQADLSSAPAGTVIPLSGQVTMASGQSPEGRIVSLHIVRGEYRRVIAALARSDGSFNATFRPLPGEAGLYTVGAAHPGEAEAPVQDSFLLLGARFDPASLNLSMAPNATLAGQVTLRNLGDVPLTGLSIAPVDLPADVSANATPLADTLPGDGSVTVNYNITSGGAAPAPVSFLFRLTAADGVTADLPVTLTVRAPQPKLVALPATLEAGMVVGEQTLVPFEVVNEGGADSGPVQVVLPPASWLSLASTNPLPPLAVGETNTVTLQLTPPADLPLTAYDGQLSVLGGASPISVPFRFIALSEARGALEVLVENEHTYYSAGQPRVADATVRLLDPFTEAVIAESQSDADGVALFEDLMEGPYTLHVEAPSHDVYTGPAMVSAGRTNSVRAFVALRTVAYRWQVTPTEVADRYRLTVESTFEVNVPWPVVTVDQPLVVPMVFPGRPTQVDITFTNHGLVAAQGLEINVRNTRMYKLTPLVSQIGELPARSSITIPLLIELQPDVDAMIMQALYPELAPDLAPGMGAAPAALGDGGFSFGSDCEYPEMDAFYYIICGPDRRWHLNKIDWKPVLALEELDKCVRSFVKNAPNLMLSPFSSTMGIVCDCLVPAAKKLGDLMGVPVDTKDMECICALLSMSWSDLAKCVCYKGPFPVPSGRGKGEGSVHIKPVEFSSPDCIPGMIVPLGLGPSFGAGQVMGYGPQNQPAQNEGVCAQVKLRLDQDLVLTRNAFRATLDIENRTLATALSEVSVRLDFYDAAGENAADRLIVTRTNLTNLAAIDGTGTVGADSNAAVEFLVLPTTDAAPAGPAAYLIGGELRYRLDGDEFAIPLYPAPITVLPEARLTVRYFHQRDVFSNDPHTPEIEPAIPYSLGMLIQNHGAGTARDLRITSGQPQIVENEKGLLIDFRLIASEVGGESITPSLTVNLGDIAPGASTVARWLFTSTLQGLFIDYAASFEHLDGLGNPRLSLIDSVDIHEMIQIVRAPIDDPLPSFLVNDVPDDEDLPDTLYRNDGTVHPVAVLRTATTDGAPDPTNLTIRLEAPFPANAYAYLRVPDPQGVAGPRQYNLVAVSREGGATLPPDNFRQTDRTFIGMGQRPIRENILHLFDDQSTGAYLLTYAPVAVPDTTPPTSAVAPLPAQSYAQIPVQWSGQDEPGGSGLAGFDIWVSEDGGPFLRWLENTTATSAFYPGVAGRTYAFYSTAIDAAGNREPPPGAPDAITTVSLVNTPPTLSLGPDRTIDEGEVLTIQAEATNDDPGQILTFSLLAAPPNTTLNPGTGLLTWPTGETDGPGTYLITVRVTDDGIPALSATSSVTVVVNEVNTPPTLAPIDDYTIPEGFTLLVTNVATDLDIPPNTLTFSFGTPPPDGATLDPVTGLFEWRPDETQGPSTNLISIVVTDDGVPPLSATQSFTVIVLDVLSDLDLILGVTNRLAGESAVMPIVLDSSVDAVQVLFHIETDGDRLTDLVVESTAPEVTSLQVNELGSGRLAVQLGLNPALRPAERRTIATLAFTAATERGSALVPIALRQLEAQRAGGEWIANTRAQSGYVIIVEHSPILLIDPAPPPLVTLYGLPGRTYAMQSTTDLIEPVQWSEFDRFTLPDRWLEIDASALIGPVRIIRAMELPEGVTRVEITVLGEELLGIYVEGPLGATYTLQTTTNQTGVVIWSDITTQVLTNSPALHQWVPDAAPLRFFRATTP